MSTRSLTQAQALASKGQEPQGGTTGFLRDLLPTESQLQRQTDLAIYILDGKGRGCRSRWLSTEMLPCPGAIQKVCTLLCCRITDCLRDAEPPRPEFGSCTALIAPCPSLQHPAWLQCGSFFEGSRSSLLVSNSGRKGLVCITAFVSSVMGTRPDL